DWWPRRRWAPARRPWHRGRSSSTWTWTSFFSAARVSHRFWQTEVASELDLALLASCDASTETCEAKDCSVSIFFLSWDSRMAASAWAAAQSRSEVSHCSSRSKRSLLEPAAGCRVGWLPRSSRYPTSLGLLFCAFLSSRPRIVAPPLYRSRHRTIAPSPTVLESDAAVRGLLLLVRGVL
ncbi:hypothetical protein ACHAWF_018653, partial [Thalassiosira exigua]